MSLMKTLARVAVGVAVAKGAQNMMRGGAGGAGGLGGMLSKMTQGSGGGAPFGGANSPGAGGGLQNMLGSLLGGAQAGGGVGQGGLGGVLEQLGGARGGSQGGLGSLIGGLASAAGGGGGAAAGGLGGLLGGLTGAMQGRPQQTNASFGEVLNSQFDETPVEAIEPSADQEAAAALMLRAMIQATKADGELDDAEKKNLIDRLGGDVDAQEAAFVQAEMQRPLDVQALINDTPDALGPQVYAMSVLAIDLDSKAEAQYLHQLAQGFGMEADSVNAIHDQLGVPQLYT